MYFIIDLFNRSFFLSLYLPLFLFIRSYAYANKNRLCRRSSRMASSSWLLDAIGEEALYASQDSDVAMNPNYKHFRCYEFPFTRRSRVSRGDFFVLFAGPDFLAETYSYYSRCLEFLAANSLYSLRGHGPDSVRIARSPRIGICSFMCVVFGTVL